MSRKSKVIVIEGPTGVGKTAAALSLAETLPVEFINADSMQVYRYMDIGTSKPTSEELMLAPHHLVSIVDPDEDFDAARFMKLGRSAVDDICSRGKVPVVVGGTALYIRALIRGIFNAPEKNAVLREALMLQESKVLYQKLSRVDPVSAARINPNDRIRIVRALEVFYLTGKPLTDHHKNHQFRDVPYNCLKLCLIREREALYQRIGQRVDRMMEQGFLAEVAGLLKRGYSSRLKSMQSIGYRQLVRHLQGKVDLADAVSEIKQETRRFAKRQLTWFRKESKAVRLRLPEKTGDILPSVKKFLNVP